MLGRHRPPHPARPGEVLGRIGVIDRRRRGSGRCSTRCVLIGSGMSKCVPASSPTARSASSLHPLPKGFGTGDPPLRIGVERRARRLDVGLPIRSLAIGRCSSGCGAARRSPTRRSRRDRSPRRGSIASRVRSAPHRRHPGWEPAAPARSLSQVAKSSNAVGPGRRRRPGPTAGSGSSSGACSTSRRRSRPRRSARSMIGSVRSCRRSAEQRRCFRHGLRAQGLPDATQRQIDGSQPGRDVAPRLLIRRSASDRRWTGFPEPAGDDADPGLADVRLVELHLQPQPLQHGLLGGVLAGRRPDRRSAARRSSAGVRDLLVEPGRRVVAPFMIMAATPR